VQSMMKDGKKKCRRQGRKQGIYNGNSKHIAATCPRASTDAATCLNSNAGRLSFFTMIKKKKKKTDDRNSFPVAVVAFRYLFYTKRSIREMRRLC
jgi:hypothetical protein